MSGEVGSLRAEESGDHGQDTADQDVYMAVIDAARRLAFRYRAGERHADVFEIRDDESGGDPFAGEPLDLIPVWNEYRNASTIKTLDDFTDAIEEWAYHW